jgi:GLPGLI family protein
MKKIVFASLAGITTLALFAFALPDGGFEGVITYNMSFSASGQSGGAMQQSSGRLVYIKGDKVRTEVNNSMFKRVTIGDRKTKEEITLVTTPDGGKYEVKPDPTKVKPGTEDKPEIKYLDSTKVIAGYTCKAADITVTGKTGEKNSVIVFYTDQLPYNEDMGQFKGLKGFLMQFGVQFGQTNITFVAQSIEKKALSDTLFTVPAKGYKIYSSNAEMMKDIQRQNSGN